MRRPGYVAATMALIGLVVTLAAIWRISPREADPLLPPPRAPLLPDLVAVAPSDVVGSIGREGQGPAMLFTATVANTGRGVLNWQQNAGTRVVDGA